MRIDEVAFRQVISSRTQGVTSRLLRRLLLMVSWPYEIAIRIRNFLYEIHALRTVTANVPVISIGNLTTGGTGKTPVVALLCERLLAAGHQPGIISRGYRGTHATGNDEAAVLHWLCPSVPHKQHPDRSRAAAALLSERPDVTVLLMDDGFQHRRLKRQLDIVLIDATCPWGFDHLLPRGLLREPVSSLRRAQLVMLTRVDQASVSQLDEITARVRCHTSAPVLHVEFRPTGLINSAAHIRPVTSAAHNPVYLVSAIGNPDAFARSCQSAGLQIAGRHDFPDHHELSAAEWNHVDDCARNAGATAIVMTLKDLVKLPAPPEADGSASNTPERLALMITATLPRPVDAIALDDGLEFAIGQALRIAMPLDGDRPAQQS